MKCEFLPVLTGGCCCTAGWLYVPKWALTRPGGALVCMFPWLSGEPGRLLQNTSDPPAVKATSGCSEQPESQPSREAPDSSRLCVSLGQPLAARGPQTQKGEV